MACALIIGGIAILLIEKYMEQGETKMVEEMTPLQALKIGLAQTFRWCLACRVQARPFWAALRRV